MGFAIDTTLHWADHYIEHGFCVIKGALDRDFCDRGVATFQRALGTDLPPHAWTTRLLNVQHAGGRINLHDAELAAYLETVYDQPGVRDMIDTMLGGIDIWSGERQARPLLCLFHPDNQQVLAEHGHIDFVEVRIPVIGNGFIAHTSLVDTEPFSGNITIYPGLHKLVQKKVLDDPTFWFANRGPHAQAWREVIPAVEVYEFVAEAGDMLLMHHLVGHAGNCNAAAHGSPRVAIHAQVNSRDWPSTVDPADPTLSPMLRSVAHNGRIDLGYDERAVQVAAYRERASRRDLPPEVARKPRK